MLRSTATVTVCMAATLGLAAPAMADPVYPAMNADGGIFGRSAPDWNAAVRQNGFGFYPGSMLQVHCYQAGTAVPGSANTMWESVTVVGGPGSGTFFANSHFINDGVGVNQPSPGVPPCGGGSGSGSSVTSAEQAAINWARARADRRDGGYSGLCLAAVFDAWSSAGVNLRPWVTVAIGSNTYPADVWGRFARGRTGQGVAPPGALVFFASPSGDRTLSHVTLAVDGNGTMVSTTDSVARGFHYETLAQHSYARELGWWLPDA
jgi:hypothetical protein